MDKYKVYIRTAHIFSNLSKANRLKVGAVLVRDGRIIGCGYNGTVAGSDNTCETEDGLYSLPTVIHAEANAILYAAAYGTPLNGCELYITHSPCFNCALMIAQTKIKKVVYETQYRDIEPLNFLLENNVTIDKYIQ